MKALWKPVLSGCILSFVISLQTFAYTYTWKGTSSTAWENSANWTKTGSGTSTYPGQGGSVTDVVQIGVTTSFTSQPALNSSVTIASLTFGAKKASTLTINAALTVSGDVTLGHNSGTGGIAYALTGSGSIACNNFYLGDSTAPPLPLLGLTSTTYLTSLTFTTLTLSITQNLYLTATAAKTSLVYLLVSFPAASVNNPVFNFNSGNITVGNAIQTVDTNDANFGPYLLLFPGASSSAQFLVAPSAGNSSTLTLDGTNSVVLDGKAGYVDLNGNNGGTATVNYGCYMNQEVYTSSTPYSNTRLSPNGLDESPTIYQYLSFAGSMNKTADAGNLTVSNNLSLSASGTETVDLATNSPIVTVGGNLFTGTGTTLTQGGTGTMSIAGTSTNEGTLNQTGSGNITFTGGLNNLGSGSVLSQTGSGSIIAGSGISNDGIMSQGTGTIGSVMVTGYFSNDGTVNQTSGNISVSGDVTNSGDLNLGTANFTVGGNYNNSGSYAQSTGTTLFNGSSAQNLQDGGLGTVFHTVNFSGSGAKTMIAGSFAVASTSVLTMIGSSTLGANGNLTLNSDPGGSATVAAIPPGASINGNVNVQRFITGDSSAYRGYRLLSSPVMQGSGIYSLNYVKNSSYLTGTSGIPGGFDKSGNPTLYLYRENLAPLNTSFLNGNYRGVSDISAAPTYGMNDTSTYSTTTIPVGNGFLFFYRGDRNAASLATETQTTYVPTSVTMSTTGVLNAGTVTFKDWYTPSSTNLGYTLTTGNDDVRGFNLAGNPYASSIDWDKSDSTNSSAPIYAPHVTKYIYMIDPISHNYGVYAAGTPSKTGTNNSTNIISSGQGFIVQAECSCAQLVFTEAAKTNTQVLKPYLLLGKPVENAAIQSLRLQLVEDPKNTEDILVQFNSSAQAKYVYNEDAPYLAGYGDIHLNSYSDNNIPLAIDARPLPKKDPDAIRLNVTANKTGMYQFMLKDVAGIPKLYDIWLMDRFKKDSVNMRESSSFGFSIDTTNTASFGSNRFMLIIRQNPDYAYKLLNFTATKVQDIRQVQLAWNTVNEGNYTNFTVERSIDNGNNYTVLGGLASSGENKYGLTDKDPSVQNLYRLKQQDLNGTITYTQPVPISYNRPDMTNNILSIYPNPVKGMINLAINTPLANTAGYDIKLMDSSGLIVRKATSAQASWQNDLSKLLPGTYVIQVRDHKNATLVGQTKFVKY